MNSSSRIYLTGFMGSGKSTIGRILANVLGHGFVDLDKAIAQHAGMSIPEIFEDVGEAGFREMERALLQETGGRQDVIVSTGGGCLAMEENMDIALKLGLVIYLKLTPQGLVKRLSRVRDRPMLFGDDGRPLKGQDLEDRIVELLAAREPQYLRAQVIVPLSNADVGKAVDAVSREISDYQSTRQGV